MTTSITPNGIQVPVPDEDRQILVRLAVNAVPLFVSHLQDMYYLYMRENKSGDIQPFFIALLLRIASAL